MNDWTSYDAIMAERQREMAWVDKYAWIYERAQQRRQRRYREAVARAMRAVAARIAPVEAEAVGEPGQLVVEHRA